ncbi:putative metal-dependent hydrolase [Paenibacillus anaericanus]|uniref:Putative metal-dependent hydrolase EJP82_07330 n=1 Tax=Paenibacillus anaericanus TaxID=170367 RepID=A0A3S1DU95_9BACL|nr:putative metal-dependent hydrolase [Paenibacillus anaericanus]RUT47509.1 putative metal-dependent hydrolase [Paenibacillus anaericanus]
MNDRYPIGEFKCSEIISHEEVTEWINEIREFPSRLVEVVSNLTDVELNKTYRENGWTIRQVVHHIADSHMNAFIRFKLALTEDNPTIKPYDQDEWAKLADCKLPIETSLSIIESLHERWSYLLQSLSEEQLNRTFHHPDSGLVRVERNIGIYAWHGNHHLAHIKNALE